MAYGGVLIKKAVERFGCNNFKYEILFELDFDTKDEAKGVLHEKEMYYIEKYDTFNNGYNMTKGGVWGKRFYPIRR